MNPSGTIFQTVCEVHSPNTPDLTDVRRQIATLGPIADALLVPENPIGAATISPLAIAREILLGGARAIVCLNARDRNRIGLRRDLLTASAYGVNELLFVRGDPVVGSRHGELTVHEMVEECHRYVEATDLVRPVLGIASRLGPLPRWAEDVDRLFVQATFDVEALLSWRASVAFSGNVYVAVLVPPSAARARLWSERLPGVRVPQRWIEALEKDPACGVELAFELSESIRSSGAFDGVHLVPGIRYEKVAARMSVDRGASFGDGPQMGSFVAPHVAFQTVAD